MKLLLFLPVGASLVLIGCGVYSFSSSTLGGIKTIAVPQFENRSLEYGIQDELTSRVTEKLIADNTFKVVGVPEADAVLRGEITRYERNAYTYDKAENVSEYRVDIYVDFILERKGGQAIVEKKNMVGYGIYSQAEQTEQNGKEAAIDKLAADIVDQFTKSW